MASLTLPIYCFMVIAMLGMGKKLDWQQLGLHKIHWKQNLILGSVAGLLVLGPIPLIDGFITISGLKDSDLFAGAQNRVVELRLENFDIWVKVLIIPFVEQIFFAGFVFQALLKKFKPSIAIYLSALIFVVLHFNFSLSVLGLGLICSWFFLATGSLTAPILFHTACQIGGILVTHFYPRVVTFLGFLF